MGTDSKLNDMIQNTRYAFNLDRMLYREEIFKKYIEEGFTYQAEKIYDNNKIILQEFISENIKGKKDSWVFNKKIQTEMKWYFIVELLLDI